jgi:2,3-diketo-5-methylthio-1-phosphopentane phosphatase
MKTENSKENYIDIDLNPENKEIENKIKKDLNNNNTNINNKNNIEIKKDLFIFDFDHTIIEDNTYEKMLSLIPNWNDEIHNEIYTKAGNWYRFSMEISKILIKENITAEKIKENFIGLKFVDNFETLFNFFRENKHKYDIIIISGIFEVFVKWIIQQKNIEDLIKEFYATESTVENNYIKSLFPEALTRCSDCGFSICKKKYMKLIDLDRYEKIHYAGDGINDYCPMITLKENDYVYPRKGFSLYNKLFIGGVNENVKANVVIWENGKEILENLIKVNF